MKILSRIWNGFLNIFGLRKNSKYVKGYLNEANMRSAIYMSSVIFILEVWLVIRQTNKYVIDRLNNPAYSYGPFQVFYSFTSIYFLLMFFGVTMLFYSLSYLSKKNKSRTFILTLIFAGITFALCCLFPLEIIFTNSYNANKGREPLSGITLLLLIALYASVLLFILSVVFASIYKRKGGKNQAILSVLVISLFALACLIFGVKVSYADFAGTVVDGGGNVVANPDYKGIICFLMMSIYVGCLLIWKPYVSVGILGVVFLGFYELLRTVEVRKFPEGDEINYITFFISLTMICISIFNQRISEAKKDEELVDLATKDKITDLLSFEYFSVLAKEKMLEGKLGSGEGIYLFINIIGFKIYNEKKGFEGGNKFLKETGAIITECFPDSLITRQSDDHFVVFTKYDNIDDIEEKIIKINDMVSEKDPDVKLAIQAGGNITVESSEKPRICVDKARYAYVNLKQKKTTQILALYDKQMHDNYLMAQYVVTHIDEAIEKGYLKPYYQPVVWSKGRTLCGMEALARWIDPQYGFLSPAQFIPALENALIIYKLDAEILRLVCKDIRYNIDNNLPVLPISINFSRADFGLVDIVEIVTNAVDEFNVPHHLIHVEITESALTDDEIVLKETIKRLHERGFATWLDDFGSGYSSFNVLKDFEFDVLKLDMAFLIGFEGNEKAKALIKAVISLSNEIGIKTLCEGVETMEQAAFLEASDCGRLQGYLYGKPLRYEEILEKIKKGELKVSQDFLVDTND